MKVDERPTADTLHTKYQLVLLRLLLRWHPVTVGFPWLAGVVAMNCPESRSSHDKEVVLLRRLCQVVVLEEPCTQAEDPVVVGRTCLCDGCRLESMLFVPRGLCSEVANCKSLLRVFMFRPGREYLTVHGFPVVQRGLDLVPKAMMARLKVGRQKG